MRKLVVLESVTLDGVMQAPGRSDEDTRGDFPYGGWAGPYNDPVMGQEMGAGMARGAEFLFGRRTYEDFHETWHGRTDNPFSAIFDNSPKYVASRTLKAPLAWQNSTLLAGNTMEAVARLKATDGLDLLVMGSGALVESLAGADLVDQYLLLIHPLVLGTGRRLFGDGGPSARLRLVRSVPTTTGVIIATYEPVAAATTTIPADSATEAAGVA